MGQLASFGRTSQLFWLQSWTPLLRAVVHDMAGSTGVNPNDAVVSKSAFGASFRC
jgi:hypothetical protein